MTQTAILPAGEPIPDHWVVIDETRFMGPLWYRIVRYIDTKAATT